MSNKNYLIYYTIILIIFAIVSSLINNLMLWILFAIYIPVGFLTSLAIGSESNDLKIEKSTPNYTNKTQKNKEKEINNQQKQTDTESLKNKKPNKYYSNVINDVTRFQRSYIKDLKKEELDREKYLKEQQREQEINHSLEMSNGYVSNPDCYKMLLFEYDLSDNDMKEITNIIKSKIESGNLTHPQVEEELANQSRLKQQENFKRLFEEQTDESKITLLEKEPDIKDFYIEFTYFDHDKIYYEDPENEYFRFDLSKNIESICAANRIKKNLKVKNKYYNKKEWDYTPLEKLEPFSKEAMNLLFQHLYKKILNEGLIYRENACSHLDSLTGLSYKRTDYFKTLLKYNNLNEKEGNIIIDTLKNLFNEHYPKYVIRNITPRKNTSNNPPNVSRKRNVSLSTRTKVLEKDNYTCQMCGRNRHDGVKLEVDHIIPVSRGGSDDISNLQTLCFDCNRGKSAKILNNQINR